LGKRTRTLRPITFVKQSGGANPFFTEDHQGKNLKVEGAKEILGEKLRAHLKNFSVQWGNREGEKKQGKVGKKKGRRDGEYSGIAPFPRVYVRAGRGRNMAI